MFKKWFYSAFILLFICNIAFANDQYTFDNNHTYVIWRVSHFGFSDVTGKLFATGTLSFNSETPEKSRVEIQVDIRSISTGNTKLDNELIGIAYFESAKYPTAKFVSQSIKMTGKNSAIITGIVTIKDSSKPLSLNVQLQKNGIHPMHHSKTLGFKATTQLLRSDFGIRAYLPDISDKVDIEIQAEAVSDQPAQNDKITQ